MKKLFFTASLPVFLWMTVPVEAQETENEPVTQKQFEKIQKKQEAKNKKTAPLPTAGNLAKGSTGGVYRVMVLGSGVGEFAKVGKGTMRSIQYTNLDNDTGFDAGYGSYLIHCDAQKLKCTRFADIDGDGDRGLEAKVKHIKTIEDIAPNGATKKVPVLELLELE